MTRELHWDHPERVVQRQQAMRDPNPHLRAGRDAYLQARLAREIADVQRVEVLSLPSNFLPVEERRTTTTPAGESSYTIADPRPNRHDPNVERLNRAAFFRDVGHGQQLSGSHDEHARTRTFDVPPVFVPVRRLDPAGRPEDASVNWAKAHKQPDG